MRYNAYLAALNSGQWADFEAIPLGGAAKLSNPQAAYCYAMEGADAAALASPPPPAFASAWAAGEMVEDYWQALTRDVPFSQYGTDPTIAQAVADLNKLSDYRGPNVNGQVTPDVIFRGPTPGDLTGPFLSQFLLKAGSDGGGVNAAALSDGRCWRRLLDKLRGLAEGAAGRRERVEQLRLDSALHSQQSRPGDVSTGGLVGPGERDGCADTEQLRGGGTRRHRIRICIRRHRWETSRSERRSKSIWCRGCRIRQTGRVSGRSGWCTGGCGRRRSAGGFTITSRARRSIRFTPMY